VGLLCGYSSLLGVADGSLAGSAVTVSVTVTVAVTVAVAVSVTVVVTVPVTVPVTVRMVVVGRITVRASSVTGWVTVCVSVRVRVSGFGSGDGCATGWGRVDIASPATTASSPTTTPATRTGSHRSDARNAANGETTTRAPKAPAEALTPRQLAARKGAETKRLNRELEAAFAAESAPVSGA